jgi:hypothetical protein
MIEYDPKIIQQLADRLYRQATNAIISGALIGALLGAGIGVGLSGENLNAVAILAGAAILGLLGLVTGREYAFRLRVQAQIALCQLKIEENTRR